MKITTVSLSQETSQPTVGQIKVGQLFRTRDYVGDDWYMRVFAAQHVAIMKSQRVSLVVQIGKGIISELSKDTPVVLAEASELVVTL